MNERILESEEEMQVWNLFLVEISDDDEEDEKREKTKLTKRIKKEENWRK